MGFEIRSIQLVLDLPPFGKKLRSMPYGFDGRPGCIRERTAWYETEEDVTVHKMGMKQERACGSKPLACRQSLCSFDTE